MRAFQPIARRAEAERNRNLWAPPPALRRIAWCILLVSAAYGLVTVWRMSLYLLTVRSTPDYAFTHEWPGSRMLIFAVTAIFVCIPFVVSRSPHQEKKRVPDPALSIRPR